MIYNYLDKLLPLRDPVAIAQRDHARRATDDADELRRLYRDVFGYRPLLGEPDVIDGNQTWRIHGFVWRIGQDGFGLPRLLVEARTQWIGIRDLSDFYDAYNAGTLVRHD